MNEAKVDLTDLSNYHYFLPEEQIAQSPVSPRDHSRLMVLDRKTQNISHHMFYEFPHFFHPGDLCVANNTRVIPARLIGYRLVEHRRVDAGAERGGKIEMLLLEKKGENLWEGIFKSSARQKPGLRFVIEKAISDENQPRSNPPEVIGEIVRGSLSSETGAVLVQFNRDPVQAEVGEIPLPPYIHRAHADQRLKGSDLKDYQTIYAKKEGSAAAPTAGLHFTPQVFSRLKEKKILWEEITLHVGLGTFRPVKVRNIQEHVMHKEHYWVSPETVQQIQHCRKRGNKTIAVGTTSVRTLESIVQPDHSLRAGEGETGIFIYPGSHSFQVVDALLTNFHLPESTLLMLVCAFAGRDFILRAYQEAIREKYRFFSYGDAMLIL